MELDNSDDEDVPSLLDTSIDEGKSPSQSLAVGLRDLSLIKVPITIITGMQSKSF